jgi:teichuronic acid biosynthesis glycosyltransferase TuaC
MVKTLDYASKIICISRNIRRLAKSFGLAEEKLEYVPLGIDLDLYRPGDRPAAREAAGLAGKTVVLYVGQLTEGKGVSYLLKALGSLDRRVLSKLQLIVVGDGPERRRLETLSSGLGLDRNVRFAGRLAPREVLKWYAVADIFVLPSLSEGRPTVINEAMATGCAIVATDISGIPEQVTDGYNGFLVPPRDPAALAEKIACLAEDEEEVARMGRNSRKKLLAEDLTWERYADRVTGIYRQLADGEN